MFDPNRQSSDGSAVVDVDPSSTSYANIVGKVNVPHNGDEFHHFGWNACSSCLSPNLSHPHVERRYLVVPGIRSSRIYILDTKPDPRAPKIVKTIEPEEIAEKTGYSRPHTVHCGYKRLISAKSTNSYLNCGQRMIQPKPMGSLIA
jgi:selenium-binding protein 1